MPESGVELRSLAGLIAEEVAGLDGWPAGLSASFVEQLLLRTADHLDGRTSRGDLANVPVVLRESEWMQARLAGALAALIHRHLSSRIAPPAVVSMRCVIRSLCPRDPINGKEQHLHRLREPSPDDVVAQVFNSLEQATESAWCMSTLSGILLYFNPAVHRVLEYGPAELRLGLSIADLMSVESLAECARRLAAAEKAPQVFDSVLLNRSGQPLPCQLRFQCLEAQPLILVHIKLKEVQAHAGLADLLIDQGPAAILITDREGRIRRANERAAILYGAPDSTALISQSFCGSDGDGGVNQQEQLCARMREQEGPLQHTLRFTSVFGKEIYVEATLLPIGPADEIQGMLCFLDDLYERHLREESVRQSERLPTLMGIIGGVAHELNNPLTTILGYSELLLGNELDPVLKSRLASISQEAQRCRTIVENLQSFGLHQHRDKTLCHLNALVRDAVELQEYQLRIDKVEIALRLDDTLPQLLLQERDVRRLCLSVLVNAHRALTAVRTRPRVLTVTTAPAGKCVRLTFHDNGCGMTEEVRHRVFEPFFTSQPRSEALGLGLSVAYGIVQQHQGRIWIESLLGEGTSVHIEVPAPMFGA